MVSIQLSLGGVFKKKKNWTGAVQKDLTECSTIVTFRCACYNVRQVCLYLNLLSQSTHTRKLSSEALTPYQRISIVHPFQLMAQITIIDLIFQNSLRKQANIFSKGIVPQLKGIGVPVSTLVVICFEWVAR